MECPFVVGEEVVCVDADSRGGGLCWEGLLSEGAVYVVEALEQVPAFHPEAATIPVALVLVGVRRPPSLAGVQGFDPSRFRKVQKPKTTLSIEQFLTIKPGQFEEPRRAPAKTPERVG